MGQVSKAICKFGIWRRKANFVLQFCLTNKEVHFIRHTLTELAQSPICIIDKWISQSLGFRTFWLINIVFPKSSVSQHVMKVNTVSAKWTYHRGSRKFQLSLKLFRCFLSCLLQMVFVHCWALRNTLNHRS